MTYHTSETVPEWQRKRHDETHDAYAIRMVREEPLYDVLTRITQAETGLAELRDEYPPSHKEHIRMQGKITGVRLVRLYVEELLR